MILETNIALAPEKAATASNIFISKGNRKSAVHWLQSLDLLAKECLHRV
jgi:hypothetical protein